MLKMLKILCYQENKFQWFQLFVSFGTSETFVELLNIRESKLFFILIIHNQALNVTFGPIKFDI